MITLKKAIPNKSKRHDHIVGDMLFAAEITKNNVERMRKIFGEIGPSEIGPKEGNRNKNNV